MTREEAIKILDRDDDAMRKGWFCINDFLAIETLKQEPCEDCVSRKEVFETIDDCNSDGLKGIFCSYNDGERFKEYIKKLPSVTPTQKWTPVSEAMPTVTGFYLIQYSRKICHDELAVAYYSVEENESDPDYEWEFRPTTHEYKEVVAWMPLPKMYHTGSEEEV